MEQILDILYTIPNPLLILPASVVVFVIPGLISGFCFKSVSRCKIVYAWTFAGPVIATLIAGLVIYLFVGPFDEGETEGLAILSLDIGIPCGWVLGLMVPMAIYLLNDRKARKKINSAQPANSPHSESVAWSPQG
jgi:fructose-specific phosphotransferase system IIC component